MMNVMLKKLRKVLVAFILCALCVVQYHIITGYYQGNINTFSRILSFVQFHEKSNNTITTLDKLYGLLDALDDTIQRKAPERKIYDTIYTKKGRQQIESYVSTITEFLKFNSIKTICEIGFAGGHSATVFLYLTESASYTAFDMWSRPEYENTAFDWVTNYFKTRDIRLIKGDSTKTVPQFEGQCDLIHVNGAHHANFPLDDMKNMARLASPKNLLLLDDCTDSWPAVLKANGLVNSLDMFVDGGWTFSISQKGWCIGSYKKLDSTVTFLGKTFCAPSWYGENCENHINEPCSKSSDICYYNDETGVLSISCDRWNEAQNAQKLTLDTHYSNNARNRAYEKSFEFYRSLPYELGEVIELKPGPVPQSQSFLKDRKATSITFVEPMAFDYMAKGKQYVYQNGPFEDLPTTILSIPFEELNYTSKFDTLVMVNVIENVYDALNILNSAINFIKDGGLLIFHERLWDSYQGVANSDNDIEFRTHPVRIKTPIAKQFISVFETLFESWETEEVDGVKNKGVYFIGRKRGSVTVTSSSRHPKCVPNNNDKQTVVFFVSNSNVTKVLKYSNFVQTSSKIKSVVVVLTQILNKEPFNSILTFPKLMSIISHHHIHNWHQQISYIPPCSRIVKTISLVMLDASETICVGSDIVFKGVSVILMGHSERRLKNYDYILPSYTEMETIEKIIMIWNNKNSSFPKEKYSDSKITFIHPEFNSMNNRFNVSQYIDTNAVLLIDDDVIMPEVLIIAMLNKWRENKGRIIGVSPDGRYVTKNNEYKYRLQGAVPVLAIGKTMMVHKKYLEEYMKDKDLVEWNKNRFCEDISMNGLVFKANGSKPIFVSQTTKQYRKNLPDVDGVSITKDDWLDKRTECVRFAMQHFKVTFV